MNPTIQSGMHPDAESLTAFAEQSLPLVERDQILAHMAMCSRCREVVFLSQRAAAEEHPQVAYAVADRPAKHRVSWFEGWRWAWVPVAALATFVGIAVVQHFRHPAESQMAVNNSAMDALNKTAPAPRAATHETQSSTRQAAVASPADTKNVVSSAALQDRQSAEPAVKRDGDARREDKEETKQLDGKKSIAEKDLEVSGDFNRRQAQNISGALSNDSTARNEVSTRAKGASIGGPAALNQLQQQNLSQQNATQLNSALKVQSLPDGASSNKPVAPPAVPGAASETVTVNADQISVTPTPDPASPAQFSIPLDGAYHGTLSAAVAKQKAIQKMTLPSGLGVLATATDGSRAIALDTAGALFLSEDAGKKWQSIESQWTGRALLVRTRPVGTEGGALRAPQSTRFELVNDKLQTWISYDGKNWTAQTIPAK